MIGQRDVSQADKALPPSHACEFENVILAPGLASLKRRIKPEPAYFMPRSCSVPTQHAGSNV